jgi:hypothetical protein
MVKLSQGLAFVGRSVGGNPKNAIEAELTDCGFCDQKVTPVNGVKCATKDCNLPHSSTKETKSGLNKAQLIPSQSLRFLKILQFLSEILSLGVNPQIYQGRPQGGNLSDQYLTRFDCDSGAFAEEDSIAIS